MILNADQLQVVDYFYFRLAGAEGVPKDDFDRWLWVAHGVADWAAVTPSVLPSHP